MNFCLCSCQTADKPYQDAFDRELELLKERIRICAQNRLETAMKELEEEERLKGLGPGGLDPVEVYQSLPKVTTHVQVYIQVPSWNMDNERISDVV